MITDKIKFKPGFAREDAPTYSYAEVEAKGLTAASLWRNLCNISVWPRLNPTIVDIQPLDTSDNDPHLFDKMQFYYDLADGKRVMAQVIFYRSPKDDRPGRLAYQGTILDGDKEIDRIVMEFVVGVPDTDSAVAVQAALSATGATPSAPVRALGDTLAPTLTHLIHWAERHA